MAGWFYCKITNPVCAPLGLPQTANRPQKRQSNAERMHPMVAWGGLSANSTLLSVPFNCRVGLVLLYKADPDPRIRFSHEMNTPEAVLYTESTESQHSISATLDI